MVGEARTGSIYVVRRGIVIARSAIKEILPRRGRQIVVPRIAGRAGELNFLTDKWCVGGGDPAAAAHSNRDIVDPVIML